MLFKEMSDARLAEEIRLLRNHVYNAVELRMRDGSVRRGLRDLDIAIAVKRSRMRRGEWNPGGAS